MNLSTYLPIAPIVAGIGLVSSLGGGIAPPETAPPSTGDGSVIAVKIDKPNHFTAFRGDVYCSEKAGGSHPYLVLDQDREGHNDNHWGRSVTYHTGDGKNLRFFLEGVTAQGAVYVPQDEYFTFAQVSVEITGAAGHGSLTFYCANTPQAAHQK